MALYRITNDKLEPVQATSFAEERILERQHLQQLIKNDISVLGNDLMVVIEEFSDWEDSSRRIDLLCIDKQARIVVVEIKRTDDGGHMELQAIRYAAMVSKMTLDQVVHAHARMLGISDNEQKAQQEILEFLELDNIEQVELSDEVRIILASADFSTELTTSVLWLNSFDIDITCIRLKPYKNGDQVFIDATQIIPLPETAAYEVKVRDKAQETKKVRTTRQEIFRRFWAQLIERSTAKTQLFSNRSTTTNRGLSAGIGRSGFRLRVALTEDRARVECYIRLKEGDEQTKSAYHALLSQKADIEKNFGDELDWQELPDLIGCRICKDLEGGWKSPETEWNDLQDRILDCAVRLEGALKSPIQSLKT
ncbi:MAG: DUF4268 domain-containing protein [Holosporales bacterium]|jgi:hypothetical protein